MATLCEKIGVGQSVGVLSTIVVTEDAMQREKYLLGLKLGWWNFKLYMGGFGIYFDQIKNIISGLPFMITWAILMLP